MDYEYSSNQNHGFSISKSAVATAPYVNRPPSPPYIHVPAVMTEGRGRMTMVPTFDDITDTTTLTKEEIQQITQGKAQIAHDRSTEWQYECRRKAQPILDFLYLGPSSVARDSAFLQREGITMLLAARDTSFAQARMMSVEKTAEALGLEAAYVDVSGRQELIRAFPAAAAAINNHLLRIFRSQGQSAQVPDGQMAIDSANFKPGKVLVFCETGNDRSAAIVAAYIMDLYGMGMVKTLQFIGLQRFCTNFDEDTKFMLKSYEDILSAKRMIPRQALQPVSTFGQASAPFAARSSKRSIEDTMDEDELQDNSEFSMDIDRYQGRAPFAPFKEGNVGGQ